MKLWCSIFLLLITGTAGAQVIDEKDSLTTIMLEDEVVISAFRQRSDAFMRPESISYLRKKEIEGRVPMSTPDLVSAIPGIWMQKTNHGGGSPFIRGLTGYQTLIMVDGIRLNNSTFRSGPNQYLNTIDPYSIGSAEVLRGNGSVQYGTDAIGGTLYLQTTDPAFSSDGFKLNGYVQGKYWSSEMEKTGRVGLQASSEQWTISGGFTYQSLGDITSGNGGDTQVPTGYDALGGDVKIKIKPGTNHQLTAAYQHVNQQDVPLYHQVSDGKFKYFYFDPQRHQLGYVKWDSWHENNIFRHTRLTLSGQQSIEGRRSQRTDSEWISNDRDVVRTLGTSFETFSQLSHRWTASSGVDLYLDHINSTSEIRLSSTGEPSSVRGLYPDGASYASLAVFTLHNVTLDRWVFSFGGRFNAFNMAVSDTTFGDTKINPTALVGNLGMVYLLHPKHHLTASINTGFRAPNINDISTFGIADFRFEVPSYDLKPEKSLNKEIGYKIRSGMWKGSVSLYHNNLFDIITNVPASYNGSDSLQGFKVYQRKNSKKAAVMGFELESEVNITEAITASGNLVYTYGQNITDDEPMRRIPPLNGRLALRYDHKTQAWISGEWQVAGAQERLSSGDIADSRISAGGTAGWNILNIYLGYESGWFSISGSLHNIFDAHYRVHGSGIDGIGRSFWISLKIMI